SPFQFDGVPDWARDCWRRTLDEVDALFVVSEHYRRWLAAETAKPVIKLGNGVELAHFETPRAVPAALESLPRPLIGYVGLLSHFLDFEPDPPRLPFASDPAGLTAAVHRALDRPAPRDARRALARPYDWGALAARMVGEIENRVAALS